MTPAWILDIFVAVMLTVAAVSAIRLAAARPWRRGAIVADTDIAHLLMAIAMAGMLVPSLRPLPDAAWEAVFAVLTTWFGYRLARDARANGARALAAGHCAPHLVHSAAMLYMFLAVPAAVGGTGMAGMAGMGGSVAQAPDYPALAFAFAFILAAYSVWDLDQLSGARYRIAAAGAGAAGTAVVGIPAVAVTVGCRIAMGITMAFMLLIMI
jgi:uncharacterized protein DUF5134